MTTISAPVGLPDGVKRVKSKHADQKKLIDLLWRIDFTEGGQRGTPAVRPEAGDDGACSILLGAAIMAFQMFWFALGKLPQPDGVVDPHGHTMAKLNELGRHKPHLQSAEFREINGIRIRQAAEPARAKLHDSAVRSVSTGSVMVMMAPHSGRVHALTEMSAKGRLREFLFEIEKDGTTFWVGAAVPEGTIDFRSAYVFFHPATIAPADDTNYRDFTGRWPQKGKDGIEDGVQRYVTIEGTQMAAVRQLTLLVPFMTHASHAGTSGANMFASRGMDLLNVVMAAIQMECGMTGKFVKLHQIGVASYSSGVDHLAKFVGLFGSTGLIRETMDFDSGFMKSKHEAVPAISGAAAWQITQKAPPGGPRSRWIHTSQEAFRNINSFGRDVHTQIGYMMFQSMMNFSTVR